MTRPVCAIMEFRMGSFRRVSFEVASEGKRLAEALGTNLVAIAVGSGVTGKAQELGRFGVERVYVADDPALEHYLSEIFVPVIANIIDQVHPAAVILPASVDGKDLAARLAARLETGLAQDCTEIRCENGTIKVKRPIFAGKCFAWCEWPGEALPVISCRPNVMDCLPADETQQSEVETVQVSQGEAGSRIVGTQLDNAEKTELTEAEIIVSGGRGMKAQENYVMLEELAHLLGAAVGASRAAVDAGWRPHCDQVGQTGKVVTPNLYIAAGISGAIQHLAGMGSSKFIVAVNKDPDAPIFAKADYGIVDDLFTFIPAFTEEVRSVKSGER